MICIPLFGDEVGGTTLPDGLIQPVGSIRKAGSIRLAAAVLVALMMAGCQPTVRVEAPKEPITINLNVKLDAEVRVKLEEEAREDIKANPDIF